MSQDQTNPTNHEIELRAISKALSHSSVSVTNTYLDRMARETNNGPQSERSVLERPEK